MYVLALIIVVVAFLAYKYYVDSTEYAGKYTYTCSLPNIPPGNLNVVSKGNFKYDVYNGLQPVPDLPNITIIGGYLAPLWKLIAGKEENFPGFLKDPAVEVDANGNTLIYTTQPCTWVKVK